MFELVHPDIPNQLHTPHVWPQDREATVGVTGQRRLKLVAQLSHSVRLIQADDVHVSVCLYDCESTIQTLLGLTKKHTALAIVKWPHM